MKKKKKYETGTEEIAINTHRLLFFQRIELLTGIRAGRKKENAEEFEANTINSLVDAKLSEYAKVAMKMMALQSNPRSML